MRIFNYSISELFGYFICVLLAWQISSYIGLKFDLEYFTTVVVYISSYLILLYIIGKISDISYNFACYKKYKISIFLELLIIWFNIERGIKYIKILTTLMSGKNLEKIHNYFDDKDFYIQYVGLVLYANNYSTEPVIKWFEENYISKNLPIDSNLYPIYKYITTPKV